MELKPGESCPVTLFGSLSTRGLFHRFNHPPQRASWFRRHSRRGASKEGKESSTSEAKAAKTSGKDDNAASKSGGKAPTTAEVLEKSAADKIPPLTVGSFVLGRFGKKCGGACCQNPASSSHRTVAIAPCCSSRWRNGIVAISEDIPMAKTKSPRSRTLCPKGLRYSWRQEETADTGSRR